MHGLFRSEFSDELVPLQISDNPKKYFAYHDIHTGTFAMGVNRGDSTGADIYRFENLEKDEALMYAKLRGMVKPENVDSRIGPWGQSKEIPIHLDSGEPGVLVIAHLPMVNIRFVRSAQP